MNIILEDAALKSAKLRGVIGSVHKKGYATIDFQEICRGVCIH